MTNAMACNIVGMMWLILAEINVINNKSSISIKLYYVAGMICFVMAIVQGFLK